MKINKKSWHYRVQDLLFEYEPTNLCPYMWRVIWSALFVPFAILTSVFFFGGVLFSMFAVPFGFVTGMLPAALVGWASTGVFSYMLAREYRAREGFWFKIRGSKPAEEGTFCHFVKEQHSKLCPMLEIE